MREIKFRGRSLDSYEDVDEGEWVYGNLITHAGESYIVIGVLECNEDNISLGRWTPVDPDSVGQYTGLKDKNGKEIWEGDILHTNHQGTPDSQVAYVGVEFAMKKGSFVYPISNLVHNKWTLEVIGNIYENKDLIK